MAARQSCEYYSTTEYSFREEQTDLIIQASAYHRKDFGYSVIWFPPREHDDVRFSIANPFSRIATTGLGSLDQLPLELLHGIILDLDMRSLLNFRQTNLGSRQTVDSLKQYRMVVAHGVNLLCALLRTQLATTVSLSDFYNALCTKACTFCGAFGGFMSLLNWERCCFPCLQEAPETQLNSIAAVRNQLRLTKAKADRLRSFKTLPGIYTMEESVYKSRVTIVSVHRAMSISGQLLRSPAQAQPASPERTRKFNFMGSCALPHYDIRTNRVEHGVSCAGCQLAIEKEIIGTGCESWPYQARDRVYAQDGFLEHFRWCKQAQLLWLSSGEGKHPPSELPEGVKRGGYFNNREGEEY